MALRFIEGFGGADAALLKWDPSSTNYSVQSASPRVPGCYYGSIGGSSSTLSKMLPAANRMFVGVGLNTIAAISMTCILFYGDSGATSHIAVQRNTTSGCLEVRRGGTGGTVLATGTTPIALNTWYYVEVSVTISDTIGEVHVRLNGQATDEISFTGDTKNGGTNNTIDRIVFFQPLVNGAWLADVYMLDDTGTTNNNFLGDVAVRTLSPNGNGTYSQLTNSAGNSVNNYSYVNEHPYSSAQYTGSQTPGLRDTYTLADLPAGVTNVYGVQVVGYMAKSDAGAGQSRLALLSGGSLYYGPTRGLTTSYVSYYDLYESDPATSLTWTVGGVNGLEAGMEVA